MSLPNVALSPDKTACVRIDLCSLLSRRSSNQQHQQPQPNDKRQNKSSISKASQPHLRSPIYGATVFTSKFVSDPTFFPICAPHIPLRNHVPTVEHQAMHHTSIPPTQPQRCQSITVDLVSDGSNLSDDYCNDKIVLSPPIQSQRYRSIDATGVSCIDHIDTGDNYEDDYDIYGTKAPTLPLSSRFANLSLPPSPPQRVQSIDQSESRHQPIPHHQYQNQQHPRLSLVVEESLEFSMTWMNASMGANGAGTNDSVNLTEHEYTPHEMCRRRRQRKKREDSKRMFISDSALSGLSLKHSEGQPKCWSTAMIDCSFNDSNSTIVSDFTDSFTRDDQFDNENDSKETKDVEDNNSTSRLFLKQEKIQKNISLLIQNGFTSPGRISFAAIVPRRRSSPKLCCDTDDDI